MIVRAIWAASCLAAAAVAQEEKVQIIVGGQTGDGKQVQVFGGPPGAPPGLPAGFKIPPPKPGDMIMPLLEMREMQQELKFNDEDRSNIGLLKSEIAEGDKAFAESIKDLEPRAWGPKMEERNKEIAKLIEEALGDKYARYQQVRLQLTGLWGALMSNKEVQEKLGFTEEQRTKLREARQGPGSPGFALKMPAPGDGPPDFKKLQAEMEKNMEKMRAENEEKALAALTDDQKAKWKELTGAPVKFKMPRPKMPSMRFGGPPGALPSPPGGAPPAPPAGAISIEAVPVPAPPQTAEKKGG